MSGLVEFLRARYTEAREREHAKRRSIHSPFDGHDVVWETGNEGERLLVDGHPYPLEKYIEIATEAAPDPDVLADLDAKLAILDLHDLTSTSHEIDRDAWLVMKNTVALLALPYVEHPSYREEWRP